MSGAAPRTGLDPAQQAELGLLVPPAGMEPLEERKVGRYRVRTLRREEWEAALAFVKETGEPALAPAHWDWRFYARNPGLIHMPVAFDEDGSIAGLYPCTLRPVRVLGRDLVTCQACRTLTHPDHRGGGRVFALMSRFTVDRCWSIGAHFGYGGGANEAALKVGRKLIGYTLMVELEVRQQRLSARMALQKRLGRGPGSVAARIVDGLGGRRARREAAQVEVAVAGAAGPEFDELWERKRDRYKVIIRRDAREVDWRWIRCPVESTVLAARRGGRLEGYAALRHYREPEDGARVTIVLDLFTGQEREVAAALLAEAAAIGRVHGSDFLYFAPSPGSVSHALTREPPWTASRKARDWVIVRDLCHDRSAVGLKKEIDTAVEGSNWHYCQGDSDFQD